GSSRHRGARAPGECPLPDPCLDPGEGVAGCINPGAKGGGRQETIGLLADTKRGTRPFNGEVANRPARQRDLRVAGTRNVAQGSSPQRGPKSLDGERSWAEVVEIAAKHRQCGRSDPSRQAGQDNRRGLLRRGVDVQERKDRLRALAKV